MDERVTLTRRVSGGAFLKVAATVVSGKGDEGAQKAWLINEIETRGYVAADLGPAVRKGRFIEIPIRRGDDA